MMSAAASKKVIKNVKDLPVYAQHAYVASTFGLPKLPVPMVLLPGLRSRKPPPIPVPDLTKRSRGRHVSAADDDAGRKYHCNVPGCDKSIHTHEKRRFIVCGVSNLALTVPPAHQCPYPGCLRGFSRTDNMMQHMRTHDDWPDDETAAKMIAESEKKTQKKVSAMAAMTAALGPAKEGQPESSDLSNGATVESGADLSTVNEFIEGMSSPEATLSQEQSSSPLSTGQEQPATIAP
ncbi:9917_t:CDS:2, partial [Acaulospora colombiana]